LGESFKQHGKPGHEMKNTKKKRKSSGGQDLNRLKKMPVLHTWCRASCYRLYTQHGQIRCRKSKRIIDPAVRLQVEEVREVPNGVGMMRLARVSFIGRKNSRSVLIWVGHISNPGQ